ncbi:hypothetical protein BH20VER1_BH20VER1_04500 [soil metagenome]
MRRRSSPSAGTPLTAKQQELARAEAKLQEDMQKLQRVISEAPQRAKEQKSRQREELLLRASDSRLDVSLTVQDKRFGDGDLYRGGRRGALRKERREGRIVFLVLVIALAAAVLWLVSHLPL